MSVSTACLPGVFRSPTAKPIMDGPAVEAFRVWKEEQRIRKDERFQIVLALKRLAGTCERCPCPSTHQYHIGNVVNYPESLYLRTVLAAIGPVE